ncbi:DUF2716 domain-containing protein [Hoeflea sp. WL0058]|uniref:DUF2716 domain-containing protein n=1 Tax=Flavimaribacter sediminis TaxID=2865987 RepID=A0AAE2ZGN3_9HYPH|nr:DUF2716 domain-containing protein [Flavimaribacter sediminis]MBW8635846.1 DUF2716 domain-containing protein [Flavimaribacter sediminis]
MNGDAWIELPREEEDPIWRKVYDDLGFKPSTRATDFPGFKEPGPSVTYSISGIWGDDFEALEADLHAKAHSIFNKVTPEGDFLYALDWQHECYRYFPYISDSSVADQWKIPVLPNGDYYLFLERTLRFGWLGHPWEQTICVFGKPLLTELKHSQPKVYRNPVRRKDDR